ncbi:hypothetical protein [Frankia sp. AvcI1]|uniref:hypothetical protein n=1 Tax=Frankia sp. AvcI1 TaxID=573496 RepID=UPI0021190AC8|nr:hypothetical protein [Frankia sp. AvcI1]
MLWQAAGPATSEAPTVRVARSGAEVVIRYRTTSGQVDVRLPLVVWMGLTKAVRSGRLDRLGMGWSSWTPSGGRTPLDGDQVVLGFGYPHRREARLPAPVWRALAAAVRAGTLDLLPAADQRDLGDAGNPDVDR